ncbi:MAG: carbohydrate ABC transporter permease [Ardenticatenaceae bacterium]|nr:carbohydrate ABC transporter permease [Ardenticatenaceae bacterium]MCB8991157.1 carbohydrate ABC transporter permease [Ardenticatenaceae bacterium]
MTQKRFRWHNYYLSYIILAALAIPTLFPIFVMLVISMKSYSQYAANPMLPSFPLHLENYQVAWEFMSRSYLNNIIIIGTSTIFILLFGSLTAYALARYTFPGRQLIFYLILAVLAIPSSVILVPSFMLVVKLDILNTMWAAILPYTAHQSLVILVFYTFFSGLPEEMFESARLDGAGHLAIYSKLVLPLSWPIISAMGIFEVWLHWNDYAWPSLVLSNPEIRTVALQLVTFIDGMNVPEPGQAMAASVIASIPLILLFVFSMKTFIAGLTSGAVKM